MAKKNKTAHPVPSCPEIDQLLDSLAQDLHASEPPTGWKETLAGYPNWLPYLVSCLERGPAPRRKAALRVLMESGTRSGADAAASAIASPDAPAWLRVFGVNLPGADVPDGVREELAAVSDPLPPAELVREEAGSRLARVELMVDQGAADVLVSAFGKMDELDDQIIQAAAGHGTQGAGVLLLRLGDRAGSKKQRKEIRRVCHSLKQRGIQLEEAPSEPAPSRPERECRAWVSHVDAEGSRVMLMTSGRAPDDLDLLQLVLNDESGIVSFSRGTVAARDVPNILKDINEGEHPVRLVDLDAAWAWHLIREAYAVSRRGAHEIPEQFVRERHRWEVTAPEGLSLPVEALRGEAEASGPDLSRTAELLHQQEMVRWRPALDALDAAVSRYEDAVDSPIVVSSSATEERVREEAGRGAREYFDEARLGTYKRRLEEMALYFLQIGREEGARLALTAAEAIPADPAGYDAAEHPFLLALWKRGLDELREQRRKQSRDNLVVPPNEVDRLSAGG